MYDQVKFNLQLQVSYQELSTLLELLSMTIVNLTPEEGEVAEAETAEQLRQLESLYKSLEGSFHTVLSVASLSNVKTTISYDGTTTIEFKSPFATLLAYEMGSHDRPFTREFLWWFREEFNLPRGAGKLVSPSKFVVENDSHP